MFRQHVRHRLADELRRWAESGQLFGGLGMGPRLWLHAMMESALEETTHDGRDGRIWRAESC